MTKTKKTLTPLFLLVAAMALNACASSASSTPTSDSLSLEQRMIGAIDSGDVDAVRAILDEGFSPEARLSGSVDDPQLAIHRSAGSDRADIVALLLESGSPLETTCGGLTPLMLATKSGGIDTVQVLLAAGADPMLPNYKNHGLSAWHYAGLEGNVAALEVFLDTGVDIDYQDTTKGTSVKWAAFGGQADAVEFLIAHGADLNIRDTWGSSPLGWALENDFAEVAAMIEASGGVF